MESVDWVADIKMDTVYWDLPNRLSKRVNVESGIHHFVGVHIACCEPSDCYNY